jgi:hypothetical protein
MNSLVDALIIEREGYLRRGLMDRVKQVDEQLAALGHKKIETATAEPTTERAIKPTAKKRSA